MRKNIKIVNDGGVVNTFGDFAGTKVDLTNKNGGRSNHMDFETTQDLVQRLQNSQINYLSQTGYPNTKYLQG